MTNKEKVFKAMDLGQWKHSWHNRLESKADKCKAIVDLSGMIDNRLDDIQQLREAKDILMDEISGEGL